MYSTTVTCLHYTLVQQVATIKHTIIAMQLTNLYGWFCHSHVEYSYLISNTGFQPSLFIATGTFMMSSHVITKHMYLTVLFFGLGTIIVLLTTTCLSKCEFIQMYQL